MNAVTDSEGILQFLIRGRVAAYSVEGIPSARTPGILCLVASGLCNVMCPTIFSSDKQVQNTIEIAVPHLVNNRYRVKFWREQAT